MLNPKTLTTIILCGFLAVPSFLFSQDTTAIPAFGQIDKAELLKNDCSFDKNAEAEVLFDVEEVHYLDHVSSIYVEITRHVRIKILKEKGLSQANVKIPYIDYRDAEEISDINAQTYNLDKDQNIITTKIDKKGIYKKAINNRISEKIIGFPEVRVGSIIEYTYKDKADVGVGLRDWEFQKSIPVRFSRLIMDFPDYIEFVSIPHCVLPVHEETVTKRSNKIKTISMKEVPALRDEPYISCEDDYLQRVESRVIAVTIGGIRHSLSRSWWQVVTSLANDNDFGLQFNRHIPRTNALDDSLKKVHDDYSKMITIFKYVQSNMKWNGYSNIWALNGVKSAWKDKVGTSGEINLILIDLMQNAGLQSNPLLARPHQSGRIDRDHASASQFQEVLAIVTIGDRNYVLDATDKHTSPKLFPLNIMNTECMLIKGSGLSDWDWVLVADDNQTFNDRVLITAFVDESGKMNGEATISNFDYSRIAKMPVLDEGKKKFIEKYFTSNNPGIDIDSVSFENEDIDTLPLVQHVQFTQSLSSSGDYKYFNTNIFTGLEKNPFVAERRFSDVFFGANQKYLINESVTIPKGYVFDELPKNIRMRLPDTSVVFTRISQVEGDQLTMQIQLEFRRPVYAVDDYANFREFYKKLFDLLNEQIVLKKG